MDGVLKASWVPTPLVDSAGRGRLMDEAGGCV
jgi:hypothetical protein